MAKKSRNKKVCAVPANSIPSIESDKSSILKVFHKHLFNFILIVTLGIIVYSNTLNSPFLWDDIKLILNNINIRDLSNFTDFSGTRYLTYLSFALNYNINGYNVTGYHVFNIAVHIINAILVYFLIIMVFKTPVLKENKISGLSPILALFAGLLFVSHPVHTMAITNINQRSVPLATLFFLLAIIAFIKARLSSGDFLSKRHLPFYALSVVSAVLAMKCKEIAFTLPIVIFLFDRYFFGKQCCFKKSAIYLIPLLLTLLIIPLSKPQADVFNQQDATSFKIEDANVLSGLDAQKLSNIPRKDYMFTEFRVILTYMRLFFLPVNLNFIYDYPIYKSFSEPGVFLSLFFLVLTIAFAIYLFIKARAANDGYKLLLSFGIIWFFINLSMESFVVVLNYVIFEYRFYLPSIGIILILMPLTGHIIAQASKVRLSLYLAALAVVIAAFSVATYSRNAVFKDAITFWEDVVKKSPAIVVARNDLGVAYAKKERFKEAIAQYRAALELNPDYTKARNNLGNVYAKTGKISEAIEQYSAALKINPNYTEAHNNLGNAYVNAGRIREAIEEYKAALKLNPDYTEAHNNLGNMYLREGRLNEAIVEYKTSLKLNPNYAEAYYNLGNAYLMENRLSEAIEEYRVVLKLRPDHIKSHVNLGYAYVKQGNLSAAIEEYRIALKLNPDDVETHNNLATVYYNSGLADKAVEQLQLIVKLKPDHATAHYNLGLIYLKAGLYDKARAAFETALKINPHDNEARKALSLILKAKAQQ